ncbi:7-cyano-7-deazaguanine synthase QueC [Streptomyces sp. NPDC088768]|uniref:7-cyano-7-deazaguanine synthase QueC n=1 Tax=Streptomyces sp. NPDC088768 TaxID=3365894 RepID=UPI0038097737
MTSSTAKSTVLIASGGMDSAVTAYELRDRGSEVFLLLFDYGQRHRIELEHLAQISERLAVPYATVDLSSLGRLLSGSALTDASVAVPDGHYSDQSMRSTLVPNRNMIMLSIAAGVAVSRGADILAFGAHAGDHPIYPDCRPAFFEQLGKAIQAGNGVFLAPEFRLEAPFLHLTKADIARRGHELGVPFELTWSCYNGGTIQCGTCGTCVERKEAFALAALIAPRLVGRFGSGTALAVGVVVHALIQIPPIVATPDPVWLTALALAGFGHFAAATCVGTTQRTVQQWDSPPHLRARVQQTALWLINGFRPLAALAAGALALFTSVRAVMFIGILVLLLFAATLWCSPVRHLTAKDEGIAQ